MPTGKCSWLLLTCLLTVSFSGSPSVAQPLKQPILVHSDQGFPPYLELDRKGKPTGFAIDLLKAVALEENLQLQWQVERWDLSMRALEEGQIDLLPMMAQSPEREQRYDFSDAYLSSYDSVFVRRGEDKIQTLDDLAERRILVVTNGMAHEYLAHNGSYQALLLASTTEEAMARLAAGEADCLLMSRLPGLVLIRQLALDNVEALDLNVHWYERVFSFAVTEGNQALLAVLNRGLQKIRANGVYQALFEHWIHSVDRAAVEQRQSLQILWIALGLSLSVLLVVGTFVLVLRRMVATRTRDLLTEVEERKRFEAAAHQNADKFRGAFESTMQGMAIHALDGRWVSANPALCEMLGYNAHELMSINARELIHPEDRGEYDENAALLCAGAIHRIANEMRLIHRKGHFVWVSTYATLVRDSEGVPLEIVVQIQDISRGKEDAHRISQQLYDLSFVRHTLNKHAVVMRINRYGVVENINELGCEVCGYRREQVIGSDFRQLYKGTETHTEFDALWARLEGGNIWQGQTTQLTPDNELRWLNTTIVPHHDGSRERPDYYLAVSTDITRQKQFEAEQSKLEQRLHQAEKMESIGRLTGGIAHDFNNILASILGFSGLALAKYRRELNPKVVSYLEEVTRAGERARDLIAQMMDFSRASGGEGKRLALTPVVQEALTMLRPTLPASLHIESGFESEGADSVFLDPVKVHQIVMNLVINARDACDGKGRIQVSVRAVEYEQVECVSCLDAVCGPFVELCVRDTGGGIPAAELNKIFDPFYTTKAPGKGTGMGLSVVHGIVHEYGGHIRIHSSPGVGSEIRILLNPVEENVGHDLHSETAITSTPCAARLMVVDDEHGVAEYLKELFNAAGHEATVFTDSREALAHFRQHPDAYDALVTDQTMPGLLGVELAQAMWTLRPEMPVVLCSGNSEGLAEELAAMESLTYLPKPLDPQQLLAAVVKQVPRSETTPG